MTDKKLENELLKLAEQVANGECNTIKSNDFEDTNIVGALNIIRKVKNSFSQSEEVFESHGNVNKGDKWGHLKIIDEIGAGGIGLVYSAYDSVLDREVAVKFLNPTSSQYISSKHFIDEARRLAKVRHPNVLAVFGANTYQNITGFWCDLLTGKTLSDVIKDDLNWDEILQIAIDISSAIQEVHANDIIHGDIKPSNVMFNKENQAVLMDFGSGSDLQNKSNQITSSTPIIMAPELFNGQQKTKASDIYSLGVVFYFLATNGTYPYKADTLDELKKMLFLKLPINYSQTKGNKKWIGLIKNMLCFDPKDSPSIEDVIAKIKEIKLAPEIRNKKITIYSLILFLVGISSISIFSYYKLKYANNKVEIAYAESSDFNTLMSKMLSSASPLVNGKDVLMTDVIYDSIDSIKKSDKVSSNSKAKSLYLFAQTLFNLGKQQDGLNLLDEISKFPNLTHVLRNDVLLKKINFNLNKSTLNKADIVQAKDSLKIIKNEMDNNDLNTTEGKADYLKVMGNLYLKQRDLDNAEKVSLEALNLYTSLEVTDIVNENIGLLYNYLGIVYASKSEFSQAAKFYKKALSQLELNSNNLNSNILSIKQNLAINLMVSGQKEEGLLMFENLVEQLKEVVGTEHHHYLSNKLNLGAAYFESQSIEKAIDLFHSLIKEIEDKGGEKSAIYINAKGNLANVLMNEEKYKEAEEIYKNVIEISQQLEGEDSENVLLNQYNLSELYYKSGQPKKTIQLLKKWLPIAQSKLGSKQIITIEMQEANAWANFLIGNINEAKQLMQQVVKLKKEVYGESHEVTLKSIKRLKAIENN